ncbi:hypothetical protein J6590_030630 [Homalodisca vitripennis]|nr:hypothetical protein J6590_030630 [Homalodisca vitripennis]
MSYESAGELLPLASRSQGRGNVIHGLRNGQVLMDRQAFTPSLLFITISRREDPHGRHWLVTLTSESTEEAGRRQKCVKRIISFIVDESGQRWLNGADLAPARLSAAERAFSESARGNKPDRTRETESQGQGERLPLPT